MTLGQVERIAHIGRWSVSLTDGSFYHSDEVKRIFGYEPSEYALSVEDAINAYHPEDRDEVTRLFKRAVETGEGYEFDLRIVQPSGETRHVHSKAYTDKDALGKVVRVFGIFQDVSQRVLAERALRESDDSSTTAGAGPTLEAVEFPRRFLPRPLSATSWALVKKDLAKRLYGSHRSRATSIRRWFVWSTSGRKARSRKCKLHGLYGLVMRPGARCRAPRSGHWQPCLVLGFEPGLLPKRFGGLGFH